MKLSLRVGGGALIALASAGALFACATSEGATGAPAPPAEGGHLDGAVLDAGAIPDAADASDGAFTIPDGAVACSTAPCVVALTGAGSSFCGLLQDGTVACWGSNDQGQLGYDSGPGFPPASPKARRITGLGSVTGVSASDVNACARGQDGGILCWGAPELVAAGLLPTDGGHPPDTAVLVPTLETAVPAAANVAVGSHLACATAASGVLSCWGVNDHLELGRGPTGDPSAPPARVPLGTESVAFARPGFGRTFAITKSGRMMSWGASTAEGSFGFLLGRDTSEDPDPSPAMAPEPGQVRALATGTNHSCAISGRLVHCWGANDDGQLGRGSFGPLFFLPGATNLAYVIAAEDEDAGAHAEDIPLDVAVGDGHSCAAMGSGRVYCWGANAAGQLGENVSVARSGIPQRITGLAGPVVQLASGSGAICALLRTGAVQCWGTNYLGELATGAFDDHAHPHPTSITFPP
ncbi:MAG TPA: hypothetical protein VLT33_19835 [Labilithrix sp.]|nr:hypothetical protein [Labilithrix sp.]